MNNTHQNTCRLIGLGSYIPDNIVSNDDLAKTLETSDEWIFSRTGIKQRHIAPESIATSDMGFMAAQDAIKQAGIDTALITHVIVATCSPDSTSPGTAAPIANKLGLQVMAFDFNAMCTGFVYGLSLAKSIATADPNAYVLLISAEKISTRINWEDRRTAVIFGDGAGASIITCAAAQQNKGFEIVDINVGSDGSLGHLLTVGGGSETPYKVGDTVPVEHFMLMEGSDVYKHAVRTMTKLCVEILERNNLTTETLSLAIPHQANIRIIDAIRQRLHLPEEKMFSNIHEYGNTSSASIPLALAQAQKQGRLQPNQNILLTAFGGGFTFGAALLRT